MRQTPQPPHPGLRRRPQGPFGWLEASLLHEGWLASAGAEATAVLVLLALAADCHGASYFGRDKMARALSITRDDVDQALQRLEQLKLVAHKPWSKDNPDGVWQILPVPKPYPAPRSAEPKSLGQILAAFGMTK